MHGRGWTRDEKGCLLAGGATRQKGSQEGAGRVEKGLRVGVSRAEVRQSKTGRGVGFEHSVGDSMRVYLQSFPQSNGRH